MSRAKQIIDAQENPRTVLTKMQETRVDRGLPDLVRAAKSLEARLQEHNILPLLDKFDDEAVTQAIIQLAIEDRGAPGTRKAYNAIKRYGRFIL
jgi:hypothetical protein